MATHKLDINTVGILDGDKIREAFDARLRSAITDMIERPGDDSPRSVTLTLKMRPNIEPSTGECQSVDVDATVQLKTPCYASMTTRMQPRKSRSGPQLVFEEFSPDDPSQSGLPFDESGPGAGK